MSTTISPGSVKRPVTPFWHRMPAFFLYPFHPRALLVFLLLVVVTIVVSGTTPLFAGLATLVLTLFLTKYALDILARTAEGHLDPPPLDGDTFLHGYELPFKLVGIYLAIGVISIALAMQAGPVIAVPFVVVALFLLPASIMTLAFTRSLRAALNPGELFRTVRGTGWGYVALLGCLFLLNGGSSTALQWLGRDMPSAQLFTLSLLLQYYFTFVMFHLQGYLLFQYHDRLGYEPEAVADTEEELDPTRKAIQQFIADENYAAAIAELRRLIGREPDDLELRFWLHRVSRAAGDDNSLLRNAGALIEELVDRNRVREATDIYRACQDIDSDARPSRATDYLPLARMLADARETSRALRLCNGFHRHFPDHADIAPLYLLVAEILHDRRGQPEKARPVLDYVAKRFPDRPEGKRAAAMRSALAS